MSERKCKFCGEPMTTNDYDCDVHYDGDSCAFYLKKEVERLSERLQLAEDAMRKQALTICEQQRVISDAHKVLDSWPKDVVLIPKRKEGGR